MQWHTKWCVTCVVAVVVIFLNADIRAQGESENWVFGKNVWVNFSSGGPTLVSGSQLDASYEGCASISDANGNLLFYTQGIDVWRVNNGVHSLMPFGTGLLGDASATQSGVIVPNPAHANIYYVFTVDSKYGSSGFRVSTINRNLDAGRGDIVVNPVQPYETGKNQYLHYSKAEKVAAVGKCGSDSVWVIAYEYTSRKYYSYLVSASGVSFTPVISNSTVNLLANTGEIGQLKFNPMGNKVAAAFFDSGLIEVLDFDFSTGQLGSPVIYQSPAGAPSVYGVSFSPNSNLLYYTVLRNQGCGLYQIELSTGTQHTIYLSPDPAYEIASLQLAPDGKIYAALDSVDTFNGNLVFAGNYLGVVQNPNSAGMACQFNPTGLAIPFPLRTYRGLPNFIESYVAPEADYTYNDACLGDTVFFQADIQTLYDSLRWYFDDPGPGNTATIPYPYHLYAQPGIYHVTLYVYSNCLIDTVAYDITVTDQPIVDLGPDTTICNGSSLALFATYPGATYQWQDNSVNPDYQVTSDGTYWVTVTIGACKASDTVIVSTSAVTIDLGPDTLLCQGEMLVLDATTPGATYRWQDNSTAPVYWVTTEGANYVEVDVGGCTATDTVNVTFAPIPYLDLGSDTTLCAGETIVLDAMNSGASYLWQDNSTAPTYVAGAGRYWVEVSVGACSVRDTIDIIYTPVPTVDLGSDSTLCAGDVLLLDATTPGALYTWQDGSAGPTFTVDSSGTYHVSVTLGNCTVTDTVDISVIPPPVLDLGPDTALCAGETLILDASVPGAGYLWQDGSTDPVYQANTTGNYFVQVSIGSCMTADSIQLTIDAIPVVELGADTAICENTTLMLDATMPNATYLWQDGSSMASMTAAVAGLYWVQVDVEGCIGADSVFISQLNMPEVSLAADTTICIDDSLALQAVGTGAFIWNNGMTGETYTVRQAGTYVVDAVNSCGTASDSIHVLTKDCNCRLFVPTAFSPNNDGANDRFTILTLCDLDYFNLMVFNRWGQKVFESDRVDLTWDGSFKGESVDLDVFTWVIQYQGTYQNSKQHLSGNVTVVR